MYFNSNLNKKEIYCEIHGKVANTQEGHLMSSKVSKMVSQPGDCVHVWVNVGLLLRIKLNTIWTILN